MLAAGGILNMSGRPPVALSFHCCHITIVIKCHLYFLPLRYSKGNCRQQFCTELRNFTGLKKVAEERQTSAFPRVHRITMKKGKECIRRGLAFVTNATCLLVPSLGIFRWNIGWTRRRLFLLFIVKVPPQSRGSSFLSAHDGISQRSGIQFGFEFCHQCLKMLWMVGR